MKRWTNGATVLCGALLWMGCGEAESSTGGPPDATPVAMWELTTSSPDALRQVRAGIGVMDMNMLLNNRPTADAANEHFKRAVTEDPDFGYAYLLAAITAPSFDEYRANLRRAGEAVEEAGEGERLQVAIEQAAFEGNLEEAAELARRLIDVEGSNPRAWMVLARIQSQSGQEEQARVSAARAVEIEPDFTHGHLWLANSYLLFEPLDWSRAEGHVRRALELEPDQSAPHDLQGDLHRAHGRLDEAAAAYTMAAELDPTDAGVLLQRGHVHTFAGEYDRARADYEASSELQRSNGALPLFYHALVSAYAGDHAAAVAELSELDARLERMGLSDVEGTRIALLQWQTVLAVGSGQIEAGRRAVERVRDLLRGRAEQVGTEEFRRAREADVAFLEGMIAIGEGDEAAARSRAEEIREWLQADRDPAKDRPVHALLGLAALGEGSYEEAIDHLEQTDPNNEYFRYQRALALDGAGRTEEAVEIYRTLATNNFNTVELSVVRRDAVARARR